jgi:hypothetical protein
MIDAEPSDATQFHGQQQQIAGFLMLLRCVQTSSPQPGKLDSRGRHCTAHVTDTSLMHRMHTHRSMTRIIPFLHSTALNVHMCLFSHLCVVIVCLSQTGLFQSNLTSCTCSMQP